MLGMCSMWGRGEVEMFVGGGDVSGNSIDNAWFP